MNSNLEPSEDKKKALEWDTLAASVRLIKVRKQMTSLKANWDFWCQRSPFDPNEFLDFLETEEAIALKDLNELLDQSSD